MNTEALRIAKKYGGVIAGSYAARHWCPDIVANDIDIFIPDARGLENALALDGYHHTDTLLDTYFIGENMPVEPMNVYVGGGDSVRIQVIPCYFKTSTNIEDIVDTFDMDVCRCWYDGDGNFHARPAARLAAAKRRCFVTRSTTLTRVLKYRARGFDVQLLRKNCMSHHTTYDPQFEQEIIDDPSVTTVCFRHMTITADLIGRFFAKRFFSFGSCVIASDLICPDSFMYFSRCVFNDVVVYSANTDSSDSISIYQDCTGRVAWLFEDPENADVEAITWCSEDLKFVPHRVPATHLSDRDRRDHIVRREERERAKIIAKFLIQMPTDHPKLASTLPVPKIPKLLGPHLPRLATQYAGLHLRVDLDDLDLPEKLDYMDRALPREYRMPVEYITDHQELYLFTLLRRTYTKYPFFAQVSHFIKSELSTMDFSSELLRNNIVALSNSDELPEWTRHASRKETTVVNTCHKRMIFPVDELRDFIAYNGFTKEITRLILDQFILSDCRELVEFLYTIRDVPRELFW